MVESSIWDTATAALSLRNAGICFSAWLGFEVLKAIYNISPLHPLSHIPGPKLAAATYWPEFYHDVIYFGRYTHQIKAMHEKYGPIVRINPGEVHCDDMDFSDEIYAVGGRKRDKSLHHTNGASLGFAGFGTRSHDLHRIRRGPLAKFFSRSMVSRLEDVIERLAQKLCDKMLSFSGQEPFDVTIAYSCFTSDAIFGYCFGESVGFLEQKGWYPNFREPTASILKPVFIFRFFPFLKSTTILGEWFVDYLPEEIALFIRTVRFDVPAKVEKTKADLDAGIQYDRPTVFRSLLQSELPEEEKRTERLSDEAGSVVGAGTETTSWTLALLTYHLLTRPEILAKLQTELRTVVKDPLHLPAWTVLEKLPYLGAVLHEGLRLSYGVSARTARVPTEEDLFYRGEFNKRPVQYKIPRRYAIGMSAFLAHHDESIYPDSYAFKPERWLDENNERRKELERGLLSFSKGSRGCLGMNLAYCELYLALTAVTLRVFPHMELFETTEEDVLYDHDMFVPITKHERGVRVRVR